MDDRLIPHSGGSSRHHPRHDYLSNGYRNDHHDGHSYQPLPPDGPDPAPSVTGTATTDTHQKYPTDRPFIYDKYRRDGDKPVNAYPESNRQAVMSALKSLQGKIRSLEIERSQAESNLKTLSTETSKFRDLMRKDPDLTDDSVPNASYANTTRGTDIHSKLDTAEHRCKLLEKQLDCMRNMVQHAEHDRTDAIRKSAILNQQRVQAEQDDFRTQLDKITGLEREHLKLTATQTLAENKIRDLEEKLKEERHHRKYMQTKAAELETVAETHRILAEATASETNRPKVKKVKKKKKVPVSRASSSNGSRPSSGRTKRPNSARVAKKPGMEPSEHYKLNLGQIPFISGQSTTPSHSLAANFQEVLSLMKSHNPRLCRSPRSHARTPAINYFREKPSAVNSAKDLTDLLIQLQDEFAHMSFEHQELNQQIQASTDTRLQDDLERELDALVAKMEVKGQQIARLRRHQESLTTKSSPPRSVPAATATTMEVPVRDTDVDLDGQLEVTTTIRTKGKRNQAKSMTLPAGGTARPQASLNLYKGLKKIQNTLRKDDLSWDC